MHAWRLVWALNTLKNGGEEVLIEGFYDEVEPPSAEEIDYLKNIPFEEEEEKRDLGLRSFLSDLSGLSALRALLYKPTCTINGFLAGYAGAGHKKVLPNKAMAKLDFRLVFRQMPDEVLEKLKAHLARRGFKDMEIIRHSPTEPAKTPVTDGFAQTVIKTAERVYGKKAVVYPTSAASGPMHLFRNWFGYPVVSVGCAYAGSMEHAPNENITLDDFVKGTKFIAAVIHDFSVS